VRHHLVPATRSVRTLRPSSAGKLFLSVRQPSLWIVPSEVKIQGAVAPIALRGDGR
jgi:hypothetical protein